MLPDRALSLVQPWAWLVVNRFKLVENRTKPLPAKWIDRPFLVHASRTFDPEAWTKAGRIASRIGIDLPPRAKLSYGKIVGATCAVASVPPGRVEVAKLCEERFGFDERWWFREQHGYVLDRARTFAFDGPEARGMLGWFEIEPYDLASAQLKYRDALEAA